jgi:hypothetical protein
MPIARQRFNRAAISAAAPTDRSLGYAKAVLRGLRTTVACSDDSRSYCQR